MLQANSPGLGFSRLYPIFICIALQNAVADLLSANIFPEACTETKAAAEAEGSAHY